MLFVCLLLLAATLFSSFRKGQPVTGKRFGADTAQLPSFLLAKGYEGKNLVGKSGMMTVSAGLDNELYLLDSGSRTGFLYLEARVDKFVDATVRRNPLNISLVIDRSGSMAGDKIAFAKKAAMDIVDKLLPTDFISIVIYDEYVDVIQKATPVLHKDSIKARIAKIRPRNSTNLWGGCDTGYVQVKANFKKNYVNRVLLISDGNITAGIKIPSRIIEMVREYKDVDGITISTFGVGLDYNETLLTDMAENGSGNYYFIDRADKMAAVFDKELYGLLNVVAQNAALHIALPKGVTVEKIYPFKYALVKNEVVIQFRDLFSEDRKSLVMQFRLDDKATKDLAFSTQLVYTDAADKQEKTIVNDNILLPEKNRSTYLTHFNKAVAEQVVLFTANENMEQAMLEADKGHFEAARRYAEANGFLFSRDASALLTSAELQKMDSVSRSYVLDLLRAKTMAADSLKQLQKSKRAVNYAIRNKKHA